MDLPIHVCDWKATQDSYYREHSFAGRLWLAGHYNPATGELYDWVPEVAMKTDVVYVPLYAGAPERWVPADEASRLPGFDANWAMIERLAPVCEAIHMGNQGMEMSFKQVWWDTGRNGPPRIASEHSAEFMRHHGQHVLRCGGRPSYGTMDWDMALDLYRDHSLIQQTAQFQGALQIVFDGASWVLGSSPEWLQRDAPFSDAFPFPSLQAYLAPIEVWSGVNGPTGLASGNGAILARVGFKGGIMAEHGHGPND